jgi:hypothetical protein
MLDMNSRIDFSEQGPTLYGGSDEEFWFWATQNATKEKSKNITIEILIFTIIPPLFIIPKIGYPA